MSWFQTLTGFSEQSPEQVRSNLTVEGNQLTSQINGKTYTYGTLEIPSLGELREQVQRSQAKKGKISLSEVIGEAKSLHIDKDNTNSLFQVASQFNLLEMVDPSVTPEKGVGIYERDFTQGPACAVAAGAGTIYRNYFVPVNGQIGQTSNNQIDCLADIGTALGNNNNRLWQMENGYALASEEGLIEINSILQSFSDKERDELRKLLRVGIQWNTQVTFNNCQHTVSQIYGSALPVAYSAHSSQLWADFAKLVLEASYEATLCTAILNGVKNGNNQVFLTLLGGGAFGNNIDWILGSIERAVNLYQDFDLDVAIVSYGRSQPSVQTLIQKI